MGIEEQLNTINETNNKLEKLNVACSNIGNERIREIKKLTGIVKNKEVKIYNTELDKIISKICRLQQSTSQELCEKITTIPIEQLKTNLQKL